MSLHLFQGTKKHSLYNSVWYDQGTCVCVSGDIVTESTYQHTLTISGKSHHYGHGSSMQYYLEVSTALQQRTGQWRHLVSLLSSQQRRVYVIQVSMTATSNSYLKRKREECKVKMRHE